MPGLHWHLYIYVERIFNLLADFLKNFGNVNVVTGGRLISELETGALTKALRVMKAFPTQVNLPQSTNSPIVVCRGNIDKYSVNPVNSTKCALPDNSFADAASRTTKNPISRQGDATKHEPAATPEGSTKATENQRRKKARRVGVADSAKCNVADMGMFFLTKLDAKANEVLPHGMAKAVCVNFTCKGHECLKENCIYKHPRKVNVLKK